MKRIAVVLALLVAVAMLFGGCSDNMQTKVYGGTIEIVLPPNTKLVNATWKESNFWYLVRPMRSGEVAEHYEFIEKSNWGKMEGKVIIIEISSK
jgi:hypothetical protein